METQITFILNEETIKAKVNPAKALLDFLRKEKKMTGPKEVCKEGDCGACAVLIGELKNGTVHYKSVASCIYPMGNVEGKHVVTIEGLTDKELNFIQYHFAKEEAAQCGFCTPGYISSLTSYFLKNSEYKEETAIAAISGNICRCTGYASIKRAVVNMVNDVKQSPPTVKEKLDFLVEKKIVPEYFKEIPQRLGMIASKKRQDLNSGLPIGGGSDLLVQAPEKLKEKDLSFFSKTDKGYVEEREDEIVLNGETTFEEFGESSIIRKYFSNIDETLKLIASPLIRDVATIAGNIVNASPIGDFTIILLALGSRIVLQNKNNETRNVLLRDFYKGYKNLDISKDEILTEIIFPKPAGNFAFNFEKVSKRTHLDIASVNSAIAIYTNGETIENIGLSAGGVAPVPKYLPETVNYLEGKEINDETISEASEIAQSEVTPISDVRGSAEYKKALLGRLVEAHFLKLFPHLLKAEVLL